MKSVVRILLVVVLTAGMSSCEKIRNLFDIKVDTTVEGNLFIQVDEVQTKAAPPTYAFNESVTIDVLNEDTYEYEDQIQDFKIHGATLEVTSVSDDPITFLAGTEFTMSNANHTIVWTVSSDWPITVGTTLDLADKGLIDDMEAILNELLPFTLTAVGECDVQGAAIGILLGIETTVTVNP